MIRSRLLFAVAAVFTSSPAWAQENMGEYWPLDPYSSWLYTSSTNPADTFEWKVDLRTTIGVNECWELDVGGGSTWYMDSAGVEWSYHAFTNGGLLNFPPAAPVTVGAFVDGHSFITAPAQFVVIREWSVLSHPQLATLFDISPGLSDVIVWVWYDTNTTSSVSVARDALQSGGGFNYTDGVTAVDWFQRGLGPIAFQDVDADTGDLAGDWYEVVTPQMLGTRYCTSATNSVSSAISVAGAFIQATGSASIAANDFGLAAGPCPPGEPALFYYGPAQLTGAAFGHGFRCVGGPAGSVVRVFPFATTAPSGDVATQLDNTLPAHSQVSAGATLNFQCWLRDPAAGGAGFNLSDAVEVTFAP